MMKRIGLIFLTAMMVLCVSCRKKPIIVACMGDSITYGLGVKHTRDTDSYPAILSEMLGDGYKVKNYGVSGVTLQDEGDVPYRKTGQIAASLEDHPDYVLIMLGSNDVKPKNWDAQRFKQDYRALIADYLACQAQVFIMIPPSFIVNDHGEEKTPLAEMKVIIYDLFEELSQETGVTCLDQYETLGGESQYFTDGIHPNAKGNRKIAEKILQDVFHE